MKVIYGLNACSPAEAWVHDQSGFKSAWYNCKRGDWLLWFVEALGIPKKYIRVAALACVYEKLPQTAHPSILRLCLEAIEREASESELCYLYDYLDSEYGSEGPPAWYDATLMLFQDSNFYEVLECLSERDRYAELVRQYIPWSVVSKGIATRRERRHA